MSENYNRNNQGRTPSAPGRPADGQQRRPRPVRDVPEMGRPQRPNAPQSGRPPMRPRRDVPDRRDQRSMVPADEKKTSIIQIVKGNLEKRKEEKDREWDSEAIERQRHGVDRPMLIIILLLIALGTVMVFSASYPSALKERGDSYYYIRNQMLWVALGGFAMTVLTLMPYRLIKALAPAAAIISIVLLVLVLIMGTARGVAQRWLNLGFISFQPSEFAKAALILFLSFYIDKYYEITSKGLDKKKTFKHGILFPGLIVAVFCGLVLLEKHLSGTIILALIGMAIIFISGADIVKMVVTYGVPALLAGAVYLMTNEYALKRIITHGDENADVLGEAWQTTQGLYAIGSGGLLGMGIGDSNLKFNYVSEAHNDFIFTIWCEELGLVGALLLVVLYGFFVWRGITIAKKAPDMYSSLVAFGITFQVGIQATLNIMVVTDLIPNTGVSLPFFSYGGTSLIILMAEMGILLAISKHSYQKK